MRRALVWLIYTIGIGIYSCRLDGIVRRLNRRNPKVLLYHACSPTESPLTAELQSNRTPELFAADLDFLQRHYRIVPLGFLESGCWPDYAVVLTFDDGYRSVYDYAFPLLQRRSLPSTVYLVTTAVDNRTWIWVNELTYRLHMSPKIVRPLLVDWLRCDTGLSTRELIQRAIVSYDERKVRELLRRLSGLCGPLPRGDIRPFLTWKQVKEMAAHSITFGSHTTYHQNLVSLSPIAQRKAIVHSRDVLVDELGSVSSIAYPFGRFNEKSRAIAIESGYSSVMAVGGLNGPLDLTHVGRLTLVGRTDAERFSALEVVPGAKWLLRFVKRRAGALFRRIKPC